MPLPTRAGLDAVPDLPAGALSAGRCLQALLERVAASAAPRPSIAAVRERLATIHRYPDMSAAVLRDVLAERYRVDPAQVTVGAGSVELAAQLIHAVAGDGDEVMFAWRSFEAYPLARARSPGRRRSRCR